MSSATQVCIHPSQFPETVRRDLLTSLRTRQVNHKFHYDSVKQTNQWLALHQVHSPSRNDVDCAATYDHAFADAVARIKASTVHVIGLGCGGGQKDTRLLQLLRARGRNVCYTPSDVSVAMTLVAREAARTVVSAAKIFPLVCDLATAGDLPALLSHRGRATGARLITFFGMIPNFEPAEILPKLAGFVRRSDTLLFSANLAPGADYAAGVKKILPQYDNKLMRLWLGTFLRDLGVADSAGSVRFTVETGPAGLKRVVARFKFHRASRIEVGGERFDFRAGEVVQLFFSYRYTPELVRTKLAAHGLKVREQWITKSGEEGVFLVKRS